MVQSSTKLIGFSLPVCILAGGRSRRFPGDKALVPIAGQPQLKRLIQQLEGQLFCVTIVADRIDRYSELGIYCEADAYPDCGPFGGLLTGLELRLNQLGAGWLLVMGCDQLLWRTEWLSGMTERGIFFQPSAGEPEKSLYSVALWTKPDDVSQTLPNPIPGLYHTDLLTSLRESYRNSKFSLREMINLQGNKVYYHYQEEQPRDFSFNSPHQLETLLQSLDWM